MEIQVFIDTAKQGIIPLADLTALAVDRHSHGDDVVAAFAAQIEQRAAQAESVLDTAEKAGRDALLASEQRAYDGAIRERDALLSLQAAVERRTEQRAHVPATQTTPAETRTIGDSPVLAREQRMVDWLRERRGGIERDVEQVSLGRIVRALATGKRDGMSAIELRLMSEGSGAAGQYLVPEILSARVIDQVRAQSVLGRAGLTVVPMESETLALARVDSGPTPAWKTENSAITPSDLTLGRVLFTAKTLPVLVKMSVELFEDARNVAALVEQEIARAIAAELDRVGLRGDGVLPEPEGIRFASGVTLIDFDDTGSPDDRVPNDYDFLLDLIGSVRGANFTPSARIYNPAMAIRLAKLKDSTGQPLQAPRLVADLSELQTTAIPLTLGDLGSPSADDTTEVYVGAFDQLMLGMRTNLVLEISRQAADSDGSAFRNMQVWIRGHVRADFQVARGAAFAVCTGIQTEP